MSKAQASEPSCAGCASMRGLHWSSPSCREWRSSRTRYVALHILSWLPPRCLPQLRDCTMGEDGGLQRLLLNGTVKELQLRVRCGAGTHRRHPCGWLVRHADDRWSLQPLSAWQTVRKMSMHLASTVLRQLRHSSGSHSQQLAMPAGPVEAGSKLRSPRLSCSHTCQHLRLTGLRHSVTLAAWQQCMGKTSATSLTKELGCHYSSTASCAAGDLSSRSLPRGAGSRQLCNQCSLACAQSAPHGSCQVCTQSPSGMARAWPCVPHSELSGSAAGMHGILPPGVSQAVRCGLAESLPCSCCSQHMPGVHAAASEPEYAAARWKLRAVKVICLRSRKGRFNAERSLLLRVELPELDQGTLLICVHLHCLWEARPTGRCTVQSGGNPALLNSHTMLMPL